MKANFGFKCLPFAALAATIVAQASASGTVFSINGKTQYFSGINAWWLGHLTFDADVEQAVSEMAETGLKVIRVWGFGNVNSVTEHSVYYQLLDNVTQTISINYGENGIPRLDAAVKYAEQYGLQLVLPLINNWDDLGGINSYCNYFGCNSTTFYTNEGAQTAYKDYISFIVNRYQSSPAIFAWELGNEPRCNGCDPSVLTNWASDISVYIASLDSTHLIAVGDEGWLCTGGDGSYAYSCGEGVDFEALLAISTIDYGTVHLYPDHWGYDLSWGNTWISEHAALATKLGKPIVLEEYGVSDTLSLEERVSVAKKWQATILTSDIAYDSYWQFGSQLESETAPSDEYTAEYGMEYYDQVVRTQAANMSGKPV